MSVLMNQNTCTGNCPETQASQNGNCRVVTQSDGNLVIYNGVNQMLWSSKRQDKECHPI